MKNDLVVNPFIEIHFTDGEDKTFQLIAPKPGSGLQKLSVNKSEQPNLHEVFLDLSQTKFGFLDIEKDIDQAERELLLQYGILVKPENIPEQPLFACQLDEIEFSDSDIDVFSLIVNPSFRYEPFDFSRFISLVHQKHLSPHQPSVWIKQAVTDIEIGYWLIKGQAEIVSKFVAGEKLTFEVERELLEKLIGGEILISPENYVEREKKVRQIFEVAKNCFSREKYVVLREILPPAQMKAMRRYYRQYISQGFMPLDDGQSIRFYQHNEPLAGFFHKPLARLMSLIVGEEVIPSYVYAASYIENSDLKPHTDRRQCEFSISFQVDYLPEPENQLSPWGLFLKPPDFPVDGAFIYDSEEFPANSESEDKNTAVYLASGDGLFYKGRELIHYRYPLSKNHLSTSLFFHYVPKNFVGNLN